MSLPEELDCPFCDGTSKLHNKNQPYVFKGVKRNGVLYFYKCEECDESFTTTESDTLSLSTYDTKNK